MSRGKADFKDYPLSDVNMLRSKVARLKNASVFDMRASVESVAESAMHIIDDLVARVQALEARL